MQEEKEIADVRKGIAKEVRKAKEAEAAVEIHTAKADELAKKEIAKNLANQQHH